MNRAAILALVGVCWLQAEPVRDAIRRAEQLEQAQQAAEARAVLARTAEESPDSAEALLAYAEFLDRFRDSARSGAYAKVLEALGSSGSTESRRRITRRLVLLSLVEGDLDSARKHVASYREIGGSGLEGWNVPTGSGLARDGIESGWTEIPGFLYSFRRMAALSSDQQPRELLPALARNIITSGYRASRASESLVQTEYLKLVIQYLSQARELKQFAGANETIDVPSCGSEETARLLRILGFRLRGSCGANAVLETVNPSRAFLAIDSGFPLADLEDAYRREAAFHKPYPSSRLPVIFGEDYWLSATRRKGARSFVDTLLSDPALARLYVAMAGLHEPTAAALRRDVPAERLKDFAHVLDFFGGSFEIRKGKAVVPGGGRTESTWRELVGVPPANGAKFFQALIEVDDGWMASYFDALSRAQGRTLAYLTEPKRLKRFYLAVRGESTSPGPARPVFRSNSDLQLLIARLYIGADGEAHIPGGVENWKRLFDRHRHARIEGQRNKAVAQWSHPDDVVEAMFVFCRQLVENEPLKMFMAINNIERRRKEPLSPATVDRLMRDYENYGGQYPVFAEVPTLSEQTIVAYQDLLPQLVKKRNQLRRADATGTFQALVGLWQILVRQGQIAQRDADPTLRSLIQLFARTRSRLEIFDAGRAGANLLLERTGSPSDISPQQRFIELLAGKPSPVDASAHTAIVERMSSLFALQRLVSLKTLFDLADHLERVSRGEAFNVAMANRLAATISEVRLPRANLSPVESNAFARGSWVERHIQQQRLLNLRRVVDKAQGNPQKLSEVRGELAPILRDTLVGLNYVYYSPPGAQLIRANPLFVRSHDFIGHQPGRAWKPAKMLGTGWPNSAGGRLVGSLVELPYALAEAEQNFLIPSERQALIWQDLAPQILLGATVARWWGVTASEQHFVALHLRIGEELVALTVLNEEVRAAVFGALRKRVEPARLWRVSDHLARGEMKEGAAELTAAELFHLSKQMLGRHRETLRKWSGPMVEEIEQLEAAAPDRLSEERISSLYGVPHPKLAGSYRTEFLSLPLFPTLMGYSSRVLAESWESTNLYWAALADELHLPPAQLNLLVPEWTQKTLERIFATHLDDWPALWRSMRLVADKYRDQYRLRTEQMARASIE